mgnify:CR=1 FL=1
MEVSRERVTREIRGLKDIKLPPEDERYNDGDTLHEFVAENKQHVSNDIVFVRNGGERVFLEINTIPSSLLLEEKNMRARRKISFRINN